MMSGPIAWFKYLLLIAFSVILSACGGGSSSSGGAANNNNNGQNNTQTGFFIDAPVVGITYQASPSGIKDITGAGGSFLFEAGDTITFSVGGISLPSVSARQLITPNSFGTDAATNIGVFLLSLNQQAGGNTSSLSIPSDVSGFANSADSLTFTAPVSDFINALTSLFASAGMNAANVVTEADVEEHFAEQCWAKEVPDCLKGTLKEVERITVDRQELGEKEEFFTETTAISPDGKFIYSAYYHYDTSERSHEEDWDTYTQRSGIYRFAINADGRINKQSQTHILPFENQETIGLALDTDTIYVAIMDDEWGESSATTIHSYAIDTLNEGASKSISCGEGFAPTESVNMIIRPEGMYAGLYCYSYEKNEVQAQVHLAKNGQDFELLVTADGHFGSVFVDDENIYVGVVQNTRECIGEDCQRIDTAKVIRYSQNKTDVIAEEILIAQEIDNSNIQGGYEMYMPHILANITSDSLYIALSGAVYEYDECIEDEQYSHCEKYTPKSKLYKLNMKVGGALDASSRTLLLQLDVEVDGLVMDATSKNLYLGASWKENQNGQDKIGFIHYQIQ